MNTVNVLEQNQKLRFLVRRSSVALRWSISTEAILNLRAPEGTDREGAPRGLAEVCRIDPNQRIKYPIFLELL
jgi:hypothetical protein